MRSFALDMIALKVLTAPFILLQLITIPQQGLAYVMFGLAILAFSTGWAISHVVNKNEGNSLIERPIAAATGVAAYAVILSLFITQSSFEITGLIMAPEILVPAKEVARITITNGLFVIAGAYVGGLAHHTERN